MTSKNKIDIAWDYNESTDDVDSVFEMHPAVQMLKPRTALSVAANPIKKKGLT